MVASKTSSVDGGVSVASRPPYSAGTSGSLSHPLHESLAVSDGSGASVVSGGGSIRGLESMIQTGNDVKKDLDVDRAVKITSSPVVIVYEDKINIKNGDKCWWRWRWSRYGIATTGWH